MRIEQNKNTNSIFAPNNRPKTHSKSAEIQDLIRDFSCCGCREEKLFSEVFKRANEKYPRTTLPQLIVEFETYYGKKFSSIKSDWVHARKNASFNDY